MEEVQRCQSVKQDMHTTCYCNAGKKATERGETSEYGGVWKREHVVQKDARNYTSKPLPSSSFRSATPTELLLCRSVVVFLLAVILLFPTRVPTALEGTPMVVDERGLAVMGGYLEDNSFRVVELCGVPLVRFLYGTGQGALFRSWKSNHTVSWSRLP